MAAYARDVTADPFEFDDHDDRAVRSAPRLTKMIAVVALCGLGVLSLADLLHHGDGIWHITLGASFLVAILALQLGYFGLLAAKRSPRADFVAVLAQASLVYSPIVHLDYVCLGLPGFLAGSLLAIFRPPVAWSLFTAAVASIATAEFSLGHGPVHIAFATLATALTGLMVYKMISLVELISTLHARRTELARLAVTKERRRFARDAHDLLSASLSTIALKGELTHRMLVTKPDSAQQHLLEIVEISRQTLSEMRSVVSGYQELSLADELRSVQSLLSAAGIEPRLELDCRQIPPAVGTVLATVLREGTNNVLRHSKAEKCEITVRQHDEATYLEIVNDGVPDSAAQSLHTGFGVENLSYRVRVLGGCLAAGLDADRKFRLCVSIPKSSPANPPGMESMGTAGSTRATAIRIPSRSGSRPRGFAPPASSPPL